MKLKLWNVGAMLQNKNVVTKCKCNSRLLQNINIKNFENEKIVQSANKKVSKWKGILSQNTNAKPWKWKSCYKVQTKKLQSEKALCYIMQMQNLDNERIITKRKQI
jgi:hypothetical protein